MSFAEAITRGGSIRTSGTKGEMVDTEDPWVSRPCQVRLFRFMICIHPVRFQGFESIVSLLAAVNEGMGLVGREICLAKCSLLTFGMVLSYAPGILIYWVGLLFRWKITAKVKR